MYVPILLLFLVYRGSALPTPFTDACDSTPASTDSDSSTRTKYGIFWSCITTIFACTWVAVHPDIPNTRHSDRKIFWHRMGILVVALIAPEYIITWAASQLYLARRAVKSLCHIHDCKDWTLTHGMFLVMGGFMLVDTSGNHPSVPILDERCLESLLKENIVILRHIPSSEIMDRSKSDGLAKVLVLIQTSWFLVQVISRAVMHLPITELELTTVAFAFLNFLTYACWWKKPLDVRYPILVPLSPRVSPRSLKLMLQHDTSSTILMSMAIQDSEVSSDLSWRNSTHFGPYPSSALDVQLRDYTTGPPIQDTCMDDTDFIEAVNGSEDSPCSSAADREAKYAESIDASDATGVFSAKISFSHINTLSETTVLSSDDTVTASESFLCPVISSPTQAMNEPSSGISRAGTKGCFSAESNIVDVEQDITDVGIRLDTGLKAGASEEPSSENSHSHRQTHKTLLSGGLQGAFYKGIAILQFSRELARKFYDPTFGNILSTRKRFSPFSPMGLELSIGVLFGSIHCAAWNFQFPSAIEQHLWRIMSLCITGAPLVLLINKLLVYALWTPLSYSAIRYWILNKIWLPFLKTRIVVMVFAIYILARLTTFVLAFTLLRDLSPGALQEVQWTTYIPHV